MCIRDRLQSDALLFITSIANVSLTVEDGVDAEQGIALEQALCLHALEDLAGMEHGDPVSYTHLVSGLLCPLRGQGRPAAAADRFTAQGALCLLYTSRCV